MAARKGTKTAKRRKGYVVEHEFGPDFRVHAVDGAILRGDGTNLTVAFFKDTSKIISQKGYVEDEDAPGSQSVRLTEFVEKPVRRQETAIQITYRQAVNIALALFDRVQQERPDLIEEPKSEPKQREKK